MLPLEKEGWWWKWLLSLMTLHLKKKKTKQKKTEGFWKRKLISDPIILTVLEGPFFLLLFTPHFHGFLPSGQKSTVTTIPLPASPSQPRTHTYIHLSQAITHIHTPWLLNHRHTCNSASFYLRQNTNCAKNKQHSANKNWRKSTEVTLVFQGQRAKLLSPLEVAHK